MLESLGTVFVVLSLIGCGTVLATSLGLIYQFINHLILRREGLSLEQARLAHPLPPDHELPHVVVQIAAFNEGALVERSIGNAIQLDWPKDKLHVQVCDDSTDGTTELARAAAARAVAMGFDVDVIHRDARKGFKAGALQAAMLQTSHEYFAIFDVDYLSQPDFLRRCMAVLLADAKLAFVQARPDFLNADQNILTQAHAIVLDFHYCIELATRSWAKHAVHFNGTCGIWRRSAIELGGGWRGDTLTEDWELSYHAWLGGMSGTFVSSVTARGELVADLRTWMAQQRRWAAGIAQVALKMLPIVCGGRQLSAQARWGAFFPLAMWSVYSVFAITPIVAAAAVLLQPSMALVLGLAVAAAYSVTGTVMFWLMFYSNRFFNRRISFVKLLLMSIPLSGVCLYISWAQFWALPATLLGRRRVFVRTPKAGVAAKSS